MNEEFGSVSVIPAFFGRPQMLVVFNPVDTERILRNEGQHPFRRSIETLDYYRKTVRPEVYDEFGSLLNEQGESWYKTRTLANPIMMKPQTTKLYVPQIDEIADEFIQV